MCTSFSSCTLELLIFSGSSFASLGVKLFGTRTVSNLHVYFMPKIKV